MKLSSIALFAMLPLVVACGTDNKKTSLETFLNLHASYCEPNYSNPQDLQGKLERNPEFTPMEKHEGIYEHVVADVSYAITPEADGCTTDLKLKELPTQKSQFEFDELNLALVKRGYKAVGEKQITHEIGLNNQELQVIQQRYKSPSNVESVLVYPIEQQDQYYMTFFAEKNGLKKTNTVVNANVYEI